jgi:hypothetical protein
VRTRAGSLAPRDRIAGLFRQSVLSARPEAEPWAPVRLAPQVRDRHSDRRVDDAAGRSLGNRCGHHAVPLRVRSLGRACVSSGFEACSAWDFWRRPR